MSELKSVYEDELRGLQSKVRSYRYELRKNKKERRGDRARKGDVLAINGEVERRLDCENMQLADEIEQIDDVVEAERVCNISCRKDCRGRGGRRPDL